MAEQEAEKPHEHKEHEAPHEEKKHDAQEAHHEHKEHEAHHENAHKEEKHAHKEADKEAEKNAEKEADKGKADPEKKKTRDARISVAVFTLAGIAAGLLSSVINFDMLSVIAGFAILVALFAGMKKFMCKKTKFFLGDAFIYLFIWLVTWIFLYNLSV